MREEQTEIGALSEDELDTIEAIARNEQTGRITPYEVRALVSVYRKALSTPPAETQAVTVTHPLSEAGTSVEVKPLIEDLRAWFNSLPCEYIGKEHWDALTALIQPTPAETEGEWVLVPREPTHEMLVHRFEYTNELSRADVWSAMLAASPTPPPIGDGEGPKVFCAMLTTGACDLVERVASLSRQLEEAREALKPFAEAADKIAAVEAKEAYAGFVGDDEMIQCIPTGEYIDLFPVVALRRAKETVSHG